MNGLFDGVSGERLRKAILAAVVLLSVFLAVEALAQVQSLRYIGAGVVPANTITSSGHGEVYMAPDIATFSFTVSSLKSTASAAQEDAATKINKATAYLKSKGIEDKDIQTINYSVYPQYEYQQVVCISYPCPSGKQVLKGYEARQTTTVKVRDLDKAGELIAGVGTNGATEVSSLQFTFDDPQAPQTAARAKAITDAKKKADELAKQLGVSIVRVVSFNEGGTRGIPTYAYDTALGKGGSIEAAVAPEISIGENKVTSDVSITYEIR